MKEKDPIQLTEEEKKTVERIKKALILLELQEWESEQDTDDLF